MYSSAQLHHLAAWPSAVIEFMSTLTTGVIHRLIQITQHFALPCMLCILTTALVTLLQVVWVIDAHYCRLPCAVRTIYITRGASPRPHWMAIATAYSMLHVQLILAV